MQMYAPRDPLGEYLTGGITFRQLRVMVEGLPRDPSTPIGRAINGPWGDTERLLHGLLWEMRILNASFVNSKKRENVAAVEPKFPTEPEPTIYQREAKARAARGDENQRKSEQQLLSVLTRDN